jgi:hypothetical protein
MILIVDWPNIKAAIRRKLARVDEISELDLVRWLRSRRPGLTEDDARQAVQIILHDID